MKVEEEGCGIGTNDSWSESSSKWKTKEKMWPSCRRLETKSYFLVKVLTLRAYNELRISKIIDKKSVAAERFENDLNFCDIKSLELQWFLDAVAFTADSLSFGLTNIRLSRLWGLYNFRSFNEQRACSVFDQRTCHAQKTKKQSMNMSQRCRRSLFYVTQKKVSKEHDANSRPKLQEKRSGRCRDL